MSLHDGTRVMLSQPIRTRMLGMESTTLAMQQAGWEFSAEYEMAWMRHRVIARNKNARMYALSDPFDLHVMEALQSDHAWKRVVINFGRVANSMHIVLPEHSFNFNPVDMTPQFADTKRLDIEQLGIFGTPLVRTNEIIVPEESVDDLLGRILEMQDPIKTEYYKKKMAENTEGMRVDAIPQQKFHAQILSIA